MALEFGVLSLQETLDAVRADNWLHRCGRVDSAQGREIKRLMRDAFYGDREDWKESIWAEALDAQRRAVAGLAG
jgi:hypothetical protein